MYEELKRLFESHRNPEKAKQMSAYMRDQFSFYGVQSKDRRALYKDLLAQAKKAPGIDWDLLDACWADPHRELQYFAVDYLNMKQKELEYDDVPKLKTYLQTKSWWDTVDGLDTLVGKIFYVDERIDDLMITWSTDEDFWVRRAAIGHQRGRKEFTCTDLLERIILNNLGSDEFFINKAIGWALREYSKTNPAWVRDFVDAHRDEMHSLSIREASKYIE